MLIPSRFLVQVQARLQTYNSMKATDTQEGGNHYKRYVIQPTEFIHRNGLDFIQGNVIKYVMRYKEKNGLQDLKKARHYIDLLIEFEYGKDPGYERT